MVSSSQEVEREVSVMTWEDQEVKMEDSTSMSQVKERDCVIGAP